MPIDKTPSDVGARNGISIARNRIAIGSEAVATVVNRKCAVRVSLSRDALTFVRHYTALQTAGAVESPRSSHFMAHISPSTGAAGVAPKSHIEVRAAHLHNSAVTHLHNSAAHLHNGSASTPRARRATREE